MGVMITCKEATAMVEMRREKSIGLANKMKLAIHLVLCKVCAIYAKQSELIHAVIKRKMTAAPSAQMIESTQQQIREKLKIAETED
jgi:hypothetical protein